MSGKKGTIVKQKKAADVLRIVARVFGGIIIVFFLILIFGEGAQDGISVESLFVLIPIIIAAAAFIVAWWRELLGGILMLAAYLFLSISPSVHSLIIKESLHFYTGIFIYGLPLLISGILYIMTFWLDHRYGRGKTRLHSKQAAS
jgi:hypothetical protein